MYNQKKYLIILSLVSIVFISNAQQNSVFMLAEKFFSDSLFNLALEQYQKYLDVSEEDPEYYEKSYHKSALCYYYMKNYRKAAESFEEYIHLYPNGENILDAIFLAGESRKELKDYSEAADWYYSVWSKFVGSKKAQIALYNAGVCAELAGDMEKAVKFYRLFSRRFPDDKRSQEVELSLVKILLKNKEFQKAEAFLEEAEKKWGRSDKNFNMRILYYKAVLAQRMHKLEEAAGYFREMDSKAEGKFNEQESAYNSYIKLMLSLKKYDEAYRLFEKRALIYNDNKRKPPHAFIYNWAECARRVGKYEHAVKHYRQILMEYPEHYNEREIKYLISECYTGMDKFPEAIETLQEIASSDSGGVFTARAMRRIADLYYEQHLYPSAVSFYIKCMKLDNIKEKDLILFRIGTIYKDVYKRYDDALREFTNLIKQYPSSEYYYKAYFSIAVCYEKLEEYKEAVRHYEFIIDTYRGKEDIVDDAEKRVGYLKDFCITDMEEALNNIGDVALITDGENAGYYRLWKTAEMFRKDVKNYSKALELYDKIIEKNLIPDESHYPEVYLMKGKSYQKLHEKAEYEGDSSMSVFYRDKAEYCYNKILKKAPESDYADDAAFNMLMLNEPNIVEYEDFVKKYGKSKYTPEVLMEIAEHYKRRSEEAGSKFSNKTIEVYKRLINGFPGSIYSSKVLIGLAENYLKTGDVDSASRYIDMFFKHHSGSPSEPDAYFLKGMVAKRTNRLSEAEDIFKQVLYKYPLSMVSALSRFELANVQMMKKDIFSALNNYRLFVSNNPASKYADHARFGIANCYIMNGKIDEAKAIFADMQEKQLSDSLMSRLNYNLGMIAEHESDSYAALGYYKKAVSSSKFGNRLDIYTKMAKLFYTGRIYGDAADYYMKALAYVEEPGDSASVLCKAISSMIMAGRGREADKYISDFKRNFSKADNLLAEIVFHEGLRLTIEKKYDRAVKRFSYIIDKHDETEWVDNADYNRAMCYFYDNKKDESLKILKSFKERYPGSELAPQALFKAATIRHENEEYARAAQDYANVASDEKAEEGLRYRAAYNAASSYQKISAWLEAVRMYSIILDKFVSQVSSVSSLHLKIGFCLIQESRIEEALSHFQKARKDPLEEDKPEIIYWIATCYSKLSEYNKAIAEYLKVPYLYKGEGKWGITAEFEAARLYERMDQYSKAAALYTKIVHSDGKHGRFGRQAYDRIQRLERLQNTK